MSLVPTDRPVEYMGININPNVPSPMQGSNSIIINEATLIIALEEYLNRQLVNLVKVTKVEQSNDGYSKLTVINFELPPILCPPSKT